MKRKLLKYKQNKKVKNKIESKPHLLQFCF